MKESEAVDVVSYLNAAFPDPPLEPEAARVYRSQIQRLPDAATAVEAAEMCASDFPKRPPIALYRDVYYMLARRKAADRADARGLMDVSASTPREIPTWVHVWWWARKAREPREPRSLPQQENDDCPPVEPLLTRAEYAALETDWRETGEPRLGSVADLVAGVGA